LTESAPPILVEVRRSRQYDIAVAGVTLAALVAVLASGLDVSLAYVVFAGVGLVALRALRLHGAQCGARMALGADGRVGLRLVGDAEARDVRLVDHALVGPLVALRLGAGAGLRWLFLLPDSADADALRRLRVRLRGLGPAGAVDRAIR
jgi:hypothetical protein